MRVVILAAGKGERLSPLTGNCPKPLLLYKDKPIISYLLEAVQGHEVAIVIGYLGDMIKKHLGAKYTYITQSEQKGDANALYLAQDFVGGLISYSGETDRLFACANADTIMPAEDIQSMLSYNEPIIATYKIQFQLGVINKLDARVLRVTEKPEFYINAGFYVLPSNIFPHLANETSLAKAVDNCIRARLFTMYSYSIKDWRHFTSVRDLE